MRRLRLKLTAIEAVRAAHADFPLKRDAVKKILAHVKSGKPAAEYVEAYGAGRGQKKKVLTAKLVGDVSRDLDADPDTTTHSHRILAAKHKVSRKTIYRVIKHHLKRPVFRRVKTCATKAEQRQKRVAASNEILRRIEGGKFRADDIFWSDESWFDTTGNRYNPQNMRTYGASGSKKQDLLDRGELGAPQKQRGPGVMIHMTVSGYRGGTILPPHLVPPKTSLCAKYYESHILENDVLPKIRAAILSGQEEDPGVTDRWVFMQDLASPHTAKSTMGFSRKQKVRMLPWFPKGADVNPLDVFVWDSVKNDQNKIPLENRSTPQKLQAALTKVVADLTADQAWVGKVKRTCGSAPKRLRWIKDNHGAPIIGKPWRKK